MLTLTPTPQEVRLAAAIYNHCNLSQIVLTQCSVSGTRDKHLVEPFTMAVRIVGSKSAIEIGTLVVEVNFNLTSSDASDPPIVVFQIDCVFWVAYKLDEEIIPSQEQIDAFANGNVIYNCWPYLREFVQSTTMRMGHTPPPLPLLRVQPKSNPAMAETVARSSEVETKPISES